MKTKRIQNLKNVFTGKLVSIRGTVVRVSNVKPLVTKMAFTCNSCGEEQASTEFIHKFFFSVVRKQQLC